MCRISDWNEVRIKGKFQRFEDASQPQNIDTVISKWYYKIDVEFEPVRIFIGLHQEDERIHGVQECRPYLDIGIAILKQSSQGLQLVDLKDFVQDRQCEIEVNLEAGSYIILPRTTGCLLQDPKSQNESNSRSRDQDQFTETRYKTPVLTALFKSTVEDIFNKFDTLGH